MAPPWHKQFWPWFLIALPGSIVIASFYMLYLAYTGADDLITDDYYRDGLAINQRIEQDRTASALSMAADLRFDLQSGEVFVALSGKAKAPALQLMLLHPFEQDRDKVIPLRQISDGNYRGDLEFRPDGRYYLRLLPLTGAEWRLNGDMDFEKTQELRLESL